MVDRFKRSLKKRHEAAEVVFPLSSSKPFPLINSIYEPIFWKIQSTTI